jgi:hypothetical protein
MAARPLVVILSGAGVYQVIGLSSMEKFSYDKEISNLIAK